MKKINIAFCFDENIWKQAGVVIASLLLNSAGKCGYDIYCVVPKAVYLPDRNELKTMVREFDPHSSIIFLEANADFDDSFTGHLSVGTYYRLMLPNLLPDLEKIIYADVDTLFLDSLADIEDVDITGFYAAGVKDHANSKFYWRDRLPLDYYGGYINGGFLILNLKLIRESGLYERWSALAKADRYNYHDQDIVNISCREKILYLPLRYNFMLWSDSDYNMLISEGVYSYEEYRFAKYAPVMLHYCGGTGGKPWEKPAGMGEKWWGYAKKTPFFETFLLKYIAPAKPKKVIKTCLLFSFIKFLTIKEDENNIKYYLFGFIPIFRIRVKRLF
jgi:lipopolysaccharide biosynthesis glycosyltransferase